MATKGTKKPAKLAALGKTPKPTKVVSKKDMFLKFK